MKNKTQTMSKVKIRGAKVSITKEQNTSQVELSVTSFVMFNNNVLNIFYNIVFILFVNLEFYVLK